MSASSSNPNIEPFLILAKGKTSKALEAIIEKALSDNNVFVFSELITLPNV